MPRKASKHSCWAFGFLKSCKTLTCYTMLSLQVGVEIFTIWKPFHNVSMMMKVHFFAWNEFEFKTHYSDIALDENFPLYTASTWRKSLPRKKSKLLLLTDDFKGLTIDCASMDSISSSHSHLILRSWILWFVPTGMLSSIARKEPSRQ